VLDETGLIVTHVCEKGDQRAIYDFGELLGYLKLKRSLARVFARQAGTSGPWRSTATSQEMWALISTFTRFPVEQDQPPHDLCDITPAMWKQWRISRPDTPIGRRQLGKVGALLRLDPQLPAATLEATLKRITSTPATEPAYAPEQFELIKTTATHNFRQAWQRISANRRHLANWRNGRFADNSEDGLLGQALDQLARTGDVPLDVGKAALGRRIVEGSICPNAGRRASRIHLAQFVSHEW
jgi:hypothetical protein